MAKMESQAMTKSGVIDKTVPPSQEAKKPEIIINVPTDAPAQPAAPVEGVKNSEAQKPVVTNTNSGMPAANKQAKGLKGVSKVKNGSAKAKAAKKQSESEKKRMFVMISHHTNKIMLARTKATIRLYSAFMHFFIIMNISLLLLLAYLTRKTAVIAFFHRTGTALTDILENDLVFPMGLFLATLFTQVYFFLAIIYQFHRR